jgi:hypothetical protein
MGLAPLGRISRGHGFHRLFRFARGADAIADQRFPADELFFFVKILPHAAGTFGPTRHPMGISLIERGEFLMLTFAVVIFAIGALGGLFLASYVLAGKLAPWAVSLLHAALGAIGLLLVIYAAISTGISTTALTALVILIIAALGGFYLASIHLRGAVAPKPVVFIHAGVAVVGFLTLLGAVIGIL